MNARRSSDRRWAVVFGLDPARNDIPWLADFTRGIAHRAHERRGAGPWSGAILAPINRNGGETPPLLELEAGRPAP